MKLLLFIFTFALVSCTHNGAISRSLSSYEFNELKNSCSDIYYSLFSKKENLLGKNFIERLKGHYTLKHQNFVSASELTRRLPEPEVFMTLTQGRLKIVLTFLPSELKKGSSLKDNRGGIWNIQNIILDEENNRIIKFERVGIIHEVVIPQKMKEQIDESETFEHVTLLIKNSNKSLNLYIGRIYLKTISIDRFVKIALDQLPLAQVESADTIIFRENPAISNSNGTAVMNLNARSNSNLKDERYIQIFPMAFYASDAPTVISHELGHAIAHDILGNISGGREWAMAIKADNKNAVSPYAKTSHAEDFAETVAYYLRTDGGNLDKLKSRKHYYHRFQILDKVFLKEKIDIHELYSQMTKIKRETHAINFTILGTTSGIGYYFYSELND